MWGDQCNVGVWGLSTGSVIGLYVTQATERLGAQRLDGKRTYYETAESPSVWFPPTEVWEIRGADLTISPVHKVCLSGRKIMRARPTVAMIGRTLDAGIGSASIRLGNGQLQCRSVVTSCRMFAQ